MSLSKLQRGVIRRFATEEAKTVSNSSRILDCDPQNSRVWLIVNLQLLSGLGNECRLTIPRNYVKRTIAPKFQSEFASGSPVSRPNKFQLIYSSAGRSPPPCRGGSAGGRRRNAVRIFPAMAHCCRRGRKAAKRDESGRKRTTADERARAGTSVPEPASNQATSHGFSGSHVGPGPREKFGTHRAQFIERGSQRGREPRPRFTVCAPPFAFHADARSDRQRRGSLCTRTFRQSGLEPSIRCTRDPPSEPSRYRKLLDLIMFSRARAPSSEISILRRATDSRTVFYSAHSCQFLAPSFVPGA